MLVSKKRIMTFGIGAALAITLAGCNSDVEQKEEPKTVVEEANKINSNEKAKNDVETNEVIKEDPVAEEDDIASEDVVDAGESEITTPDDSVQKPIREPDSTDAKKPSSEQVQQPKETPVVCQKPSTDNSYVVQTGDTLSKISLKHNLSIEKLKSINDLKSSLIYVCQELNLKEELVPEDQQTEEEAQEEITDEQKQEEIEIVPEEQNEEKEDTNKGIVELQKPVAAEGYTRGMSGILVEGIASPGSYVYLYSLNEKSYYHESSPEQFFRYTTTDENGNFSLWLPILSDGTYETVLLSKWKETEKGDYDSFEFSDPFPLTIDSYFTGNLGLDRTTTVRIENQYAHGMTFSSDMHEYIKEIMVRYTQGDIEKTYFFNNVELSEEILAISDLSMFNDGRISVHAEATDWAGNKGSLDEPILLTKDTVKPEVPVVISDDVYIDEFSHDGGVYSFQVEGEVGLTLYARVKGTSTFIKGYRNGLNENQYYVTFSGIRDRLEQYGAVEIEYYVADIGKNKSDLSVFTLKKE